MRVENGITMETYKIVRPGKVSVSPRLRHITIKGIIVTVAGTIVEKTWIFTARTLPNYKSQPCEESG